jgi:hypothetical protein
VALLGGAAVQAAVRAALAALPRLQWRYAAAPAALAASILLVSGGVAAHPQPTYPWYHLYTSEEFHAFQRAAQAVSGDPNARIITTTWQPALLVKTLAAPDQARYSTTFFSDPSERQRVLAEHPGSAKYVVVDKYVEKQAQQNGGDLSILDGPDWRVAYRTSTGSLTLYQWEGGT